MPLGQGLSYQQAPSGENLELHIIHPDPEHQHTTGQGLDRDPVLFTLFTLGCSAIHSTNRIIRVVDNTTVVGLISDNDSLQSGDLAPDKKNKVAL